ncbi:MAG: PqiC family protein [Puniceicoccales bacterium]|nr:PqiC family protein [Puniceicoccales bacterium]
MCKILMLYAALLCGCSMFTPQKDNAIFHTLGDHSANVEKVQDETTKRIVINLLIDEIPAYADCPYIATKGTGNVIIFSDIHRWAEPFEDACIRILQDRLSMAMKDSAMIVSSMRAVGNTMTSDYRLSVDFDDIICNAEEGRVVLKCSWSLFDYSGREQVLLRRYIGMKEVQNDASYESIVSTMKIVLLELADDMAKEIERMQLTAKVSGKTSIKSRSAHPSISVDHSFPH